MLILLPGLADLAQRATELHFGWFAYGTMVPAGHKLQTAAMALKGVLLLASALIGWRWFQLDSLSNPAGTLGGPSLRGADPLVRPLPARLLATLLTIVAAVLPLTLFHIGLEFAARGHPDALIWPMLLIADPLVVAALGATFAGACFTASRLT